MSKSAATKNFGLETYPATPKIEMIAIADLLLAAEAPKELNLVVRNSSSGSPLPDAELKASIYTKGIIQPLIYKKVDGKYYVVAGNRRLRMLREIFGVDSGDFVQTQDVEEFGVDWREIAIDTNLSLPPHIVERYELIVALAKDQGLPAAEVCARYGMSDQQYHRVMALGKMAPVVRQAWKDAEIDAKAAQAFTLEPDTKEQERIFASLKKGDNLNDWQIRGRILPPIQREIGKLVAFIGLEAVEKAKLLKQKDFFADERASHHIVTDPKALNKLVGDKLADACKALVDAGWKWAIPESKIEGSLYYYSTVEPDKKGAYTPAQMAKSGCVLMIEHSGELRIEYGRVKPADKKQVTASERVKKPAAPKKPGVVTLTNALAERLSLQLEEALSTAITVTPHVAVAAMIAGFSSSGHIIDVGVNGNTQSRFGVSAGEKNFLQIFEGALKASPESQAVMLASVVSAALSIQIHSAEAKAPIEDKGLQALVAAMRPDAVNKAITESFDAKGYFDSVSRDACIDAVRCAMGDDHAAKVGKMKKGEAAKFAAGNVPKTGWLPKELRTVHYKGPSEEAAKKVKKPKPVKKAPAKKKTRK